MWGKSKYPGLQEIHCNRKKRREKQITVTEGRESKCCKEEVNEELLSEFRRGEITACWEHGDMKMKLHFFGVTHTLTPHSKVFPSRPLLKNQSLWLWDCWVCTPNQGALWLRCWDSSHDGNELHYLSTSPSGLDSSKSYFLLIRRLTFCSVLVMATKGRKAKAVLLFLDNCALCIRWGCPHFYLPWSAW